MYLVLFHFIVLSPVIITQPMDQLFIPLGTDAVFSIVASGSSLSYQWCKDGTDIMDTNQVYAGTNTDTLTVLDVQDSSDEGQFTVKVSNAAATVISESAVLTVREFLFVLRISLVIGKITTWTKLLFRSLYH